MTNIGYFATYARFHTLDKESAGAFFGADNIIGGKFTVDHEITPDSNYAWIVNPFGQKMGYLDRKTADQVDLCQAKGWTTVALLALVAFSEQPEPGQYWGEVVIISYDPQYEEAFSTFMDQIAKQLSHGSRPNVSLGPDSLQKVIDSKGTWMPKDRVALPKKKKGTAWVKTQQSGTEFLVEQARKGNVGCTIATCIFWIAVAAAIVFGLRSCGVLPF